MSLIKGGRWRTPLTAGCGKGLGGDGRLQAFDGKSCKVFYAAVLTEALLQQDPSEVNSVGLGVFPRVNRTKGTDFIEACLSD